MSLLAASSPFKLLPGYTDHINVSKLRNPLKSEHFRCSLGKIRVLGSGGVALSQCRRSRLRLFSFPESTSDLEVEIVVEDEDEGVVSSRGQNLVLSLLANSVRVGVWALTVAALALVSRNLRPAFAATPAHACVLSEELLCSSSIANKINGDAKNTLPRKTEASRSLFFASKSLSDNEGLVQLENQKVDEANEEFVAWMDTVRRDALNEGVSDEVLKWALEDVTVSKDSIVHRKTAPEVKLLLDAYLKRMVVEQRVSAGASRLKENSELLTEVSQKFGVPVRFLVAIWGVETNYGSFMGNWDIIQSLATMGFSEVLACIPPHAQFEDRRKYFRGELLEALLMLQKGTAEQGTGPQGEKRLRGSWAGAMGQCQFMPTSFRDFAIDYDGDGRKDIWESKADIFASIANYFKEHGWKTGGPIFQKVQVPKKLDKSLLGLGVVKSVLDWEHKHGVHLNPGKAPPLPPYEMASLLMPNGPKGDAYLVCDNFRVILSYNSSDLYGFAVCELARLIEERASNPYPTPQL